MPTDYNLTIDGASHVLHWDSPTPPTQADIEGIVGQYHGVKSTPQKPAWTPPMNGAPDVPANVARARTSAAIGKLEEQTGIQSESLRGHATPEKINQWINRNINQINSPEMKVARVPNPGAKRGQPSSTLEKAEESYVPVPIRGGAAPPGAIGIGPMDKVIKVNGKVVKNLGPVFPSNEPSLAAKLLNTDLGQGYAATANDKEHPIQAFGATLGTGIAGILNSRDWAALAALGPLGLGRIAAGGFGLLQGKQAIQDVGEGNYGGAAADALIAAILAKHAATTPVDIPIEARENTLSLGDVGKLVKPKPLPPTDLTPRQAELLKSITTPPQEAVRTSVKPPVPTLPDMQETPPVMEPPVRQMKPKKAPAAVSLPPNGEYVPPALEKQSPVEANVYRARSASDTPSGSSRYGNGTYSTTSEGVANIFAEHRGAGAKVEPGLVRLERPFVDTIPDTSTSEYQNLRQSLIDEGMKPAAIDGAASGSARHGLFQAGARFLADKYKDNPNLFPGTERMRQKVEAAGYDGIVGHTQNSPDLPNHVEIVEFKKTSIDTGTPPPEGQTGAKNATTLAERLERGMDPVQKQAFTNQKEAFKQGVQANESDPTYARKLAQEVARNPRPLTAKEVGALAHDRAQLTANYENTTDALNAAIDSGTDTADLHQQYKTLRDALDINDQALTKGGTEQSSAFAARKMMVSTDDYTYAGIERRAKANKGKPLTSDEVDELQGLIKEHKLALAEEKAQNAAHQETIETQKSQISEMEAKDRARAEELAMNKAKRAAETDAKRAPRQQRRTDLNAEFSELKAEAAAAWKGRGEKSSKSRLQMALDPSAGKFDEAELGDLIKIVGKMAKNRVAAGVNALPDLVTTIHAALVDHIENLTEGDVRDAFSGYGRQMARAATEQQKTLSELKKQARLIAAIEDAEKGEMPAKGPTPEKPSGKVVELRRQLDESMTKTGLKQKAAPTMAARQLTKQRALERQIDALDAQIKGTAPAKGKPAVVPDNEMIKRLTAERDALKAQLPKPQKPPKAPVDELAQAKKRVQAQIDDMTEQLKTGAYKQRKAPLMGDSELNRMRDEAAKIRQAVALSKRKIDQRVAAFDKPHWTDYLIAGQRASLLSGIPTLGKLGSAAASRGGLSPVEEVFGGALSHVPGLQKVADLSPREGRASVRAEVAAFKEYFNRASYKDALTKLKTGMNSLDLQFDPKVHISRLNAKAEAVLGFFGRLHGAIKTPAQRAEFMRSFEKRTEFALRNGQDIHDPAVQEQIGLGAYLDSKRAILMQDNPFSGWWSSSLNGVEKRGPMGRTISTVGHVLVPIAKMGTNFASEVGNYSAGGANAAARAIFSKFKGEMSPVQADAIMRAVKKQGIGAGLALLTYYGIAKSGGYVGDKKMGSQKDSHGNPLHPGDLEVFGVHIPHFLAHIPAFEVIHMVSTYLQHRQRNDSAEGLFQAAKGAAQNVPQLDEILRLAQGAESSNAAGKVAGNLVAGVTEPRIMQDIAAMLDKKAQNGKYRAPKGFLDTLKKGVPGLREQVPLKSGR